MVALVMTLVAVLSAFVRQDIKGSIVRVSCNLAIALMILDKNVRGNIE